jgi:uncharacterized protein YjdB
VGAAAAVLFICASVGGCLEDSLAPASHTARLDVHRVVAQVNAGEQATVVVDVGYWTNSEEVRPLPVTPSRIAIDAGATISTPIVVTLDPCIADPDAYHESSEGDTTVTGGCLLEVTFTLLDAAESEISSASTVVNFPVTPGQTIELEDVVLSNVWSVEVAPINTLSPGQIVTAVATARTKSGEVVSNATFGWHSYDTNVVTVDSTTGVIEAISAGSTYLEVVSDGVYGGTQVTVEQPINFATGAAGDSCVTAGAGTSCPGDSKASAAAPRTGVKP